MSQKRKRQVRVRVPKGARLAHFFFRPGGKILGASLVLALIAATGVFTTYYVKYAELIDGKLRSGPFPNTSKIFAAPQFVAVGDPSTPEEIAAELRRAGYTESRGNSVGYYRLAAGSIEIYPGRDSYSEQEAARLEFAQGKAIARVFSLRDHTERPQYELEPQLITNLFGANREKRRLVKFRDIPAVLVAAVTSAEDKRFFYHTGFDPIRIIKAVYVDVKEGRKEQGASTLSQQLARSLWLEPDKHWRRKLAELLISLQLEARLSKEEIFETYANQVYLGRRGSFNIHGFGEAAEAYFNKDIRHLTLPEAATLAGIIQRPGVFDPFRRPDRVRARRNLVLGLMRENGHITDREYALAAESPLTVARSPAQSLDAPYFVDIVNEELGERFQDLDFQNQSFRIYTSLDLNLQRAAAEAVQAGMQQVDEQLNKRKRNQGLPSAQAALVALDPHTGVVKALIGGRNYGISQLNRALAKRQPGSIFKPFVFAAALDTAVEGGPHILTAGTTVLDEPTTFWYDGKPYEPGNFKQEYHGQVTFRQALAKSMNVATVKVAEMAGYDAVVEMARRAGLNYQIQPTPAVALGAYEVSPLEMASAYTMFATSGSFVPRSFISTIRSRGGEVVFQHKQETRKALDPRVAYLMTSLLEEVVRSGTAAGVRARGFAVPAAGKTGTSHDGWFAGFTSELLCIVWVGFDDNRELGLEGARSALPIWTEFMKRAHRLRPYRAAKPFTAPDGIVAVQLDPVSGRPATPFCPLTRAEFFVAGTQPVGTCSLHGGSRGVTQVAGWEVAAPPVLDQPRLVPLGNGEATVAAMRPPAPEAQDAPPVAAQSKHEKPKEEKKKGIFRRLLGVFK